MTCAFWDKQYFMHCTLILLDSLEKLTLKVHKFIQFEKQTFHFPFLKLLLPVFYFSIFWLLSVLLLL